LSGKITITYACDGCGHEFETAGRLEHYFGNGHHLWDEEEYRAECQECRLEKARIKSIHDHEGERLF